MGKSVPRRMSPNRAIASPTSPTRVAPPVMQPPMEKTEKQPMEKPPILTPKPRTLSASEGTTGERRSRLDNNPPG